MPAVIFIINSNLRGKMIDFVKDYLMMAVKVVTGFNPTLIIVTSKKIIISTQNALVINDPSLRDITAGDPSLRDNETGWYSDSYIPRWH